MFVMQCSTQLHTSSQPSLPIDHSLQTHSPSSSHVMTTHTMNPNVWLGVTLIAHLVAVHAQSPNGAVLEDSAVVQEVPPPPPPLDDSTCDSSVPSAWWHLIHAPTFYWWAVRGPCRESATSQHRSCALSSPRARLAH
jgi:hypothetical protein